MSSNTTKSQAEVIEFTKIALQNVTTNPSIQPLMEALSYTTEKIDEGKELLYNAETATSTNQTLIDQKTKAYKEFEDLKITLETIYAKDRKKARVILKKDTLTYKKLALKGVKSRVYIKWLASLKTFYNLLNTNTAILAKLAPLQITQAHVTNILNQLKTLESLKAAYIQTKGNAQNATKTKYEAFKALEQWMGSFFVVAKIALEHKPQLLESLGKVVKG